MILWDASNLNFVFKKESNQNTKLWASNYGIHPTAVTQAMFPLIVGEDCYIINTNLGFVIERIVMLLFNYAFEILKILKSDM